MSAYIPFAAGFFVLLAFGVHYLYEWSHEEAVATDHLIAHKSAYLNLPFLMLRIVLYFGLWILMTKLLRRVSLKEDMEGGLAYFYKSEHLSKIFIFIVAITFFCFFSRYAHVS